MTPPKELVYTDPTTRFATYPLSIQYGTEPKNKVDISVSILDCRPNIQDFPMSVTSGDSKTATIYDTAFYPTVDVDGIPTDYTAVCAADVLFVFEFVPIDAVWGSFITWENYVITVVMPTESTADHTGLKEIKITYGIYSETV